jgi:hypothetical protein
LPPLTSPPCLAFFIACLTWNHNHFCHLRFPITGELFQNKSGFCLPFCH